MENNAELKKALQIGTVCIFSYMVSYYVRNLLSVSTPSMLEEGNFTKEFVGTLSSVYFLLYAIGQLINGIIGDVVKPRIMITLGLIVGGLVSIVFAFTDIKLVQIILFALLGFALSMLRGPVVKTISENSLPHYAQTSCVFLSFASFCGPLIASLLSIVFNWRITFIVAGVSAVCVGICAYFVLTVMEKKKIISFSGGGKSLELKNILKVFKLEHFVFYMFVGGLVEIAASSIGFWIPTYFTERIGLPTEIAKIIYSVINIAKAATPFLTICVLRLFKDNAIRMIRYCFLLSTLAFAGVLFVTEAYANTVLFLLALIAAGGASALMWSVYIPSQANSGMVSTVNGVLDFSGYVATSAANMVFSYAMSYVGWNGIIVLWLLLMLSGAIVAMFKKSK